VTRGPQSTSESPGTWLQSFAERRLELNLSTLELAFLALLRRRGASDATSSFSEEHLQDAFETAAENIDPNSANLKVRATHTLRRLREQRLLTRVDANGVLRAGEYALSRLAIGIVDFFLEDQVLTSETLAPLTQALVTTLTHVRELAATLLAADSCASTLGTEQWARINGPLDVTCRELLVAIEKRQLGLDHQQEQFQKDIANLLSADWFGSLEHCQHLLDTSANALQELNEVLLRDSNQLHTLLSELTALFSEHCESRETHEPLAPHEDGADAALQAAVNLSEHIDRIGTWGAVRQKAWSDYYEYVHRYLRDVVRLDPSRALSQRLRQQLIEHGKRPFTLSVAAEVGIRVLREPAPLELPPPVRRERKPREKEPRINPPAPDPLAALETRVNELMAEGVETLTELTERLTTELEPNERFLVAGRIAELVGRLPQSDVLRERPWVNIQNDLAIEQRTVRSEAAPYAAKDRFNE
jgi:chromosome partition protein MukF